MQLSLQRQRFKAIDKELPAECRDVFLQGVQQQQFANYDGPVPHNSVKLEIQA